MSRLWSESELKYLTDKYSCTRTITDLQKGLPDRSNQSIRVKACRLGILKQVRAYDKDINKDFFKIWNHNMVWCLGLIYADGSLIYDKKSDRTRLLISSNDKDMLDKIKRMMQSDYAITKYLNSPCWQLQFGDGIFCNDLMILGVMRRKSLIIEFPLMIPKEYMPDFIRGFMDGDGSLYMNYDKFFYAAFTSGSKKFIEGIRQFLCNEIGVKKNKISEGTAYVVRWGGSQALKVCEYMYTSDMGEAFLDRKYNKYVSYITSCMRKTDNGGMGKGMKDCSTTWEKMSDADKKKYEPKET